MEYKIMSNGSTVEINMSDEVIFDDYNNFRIIIDKLDPNQHDHCLVDMKKVEFIDSAGLGMLLLLHEDASNKKIKVTILSGTGQVARMMELAKFDTMFTIISGNA